MVYVPQPELGVAPGLPPLPALLIINLAKTIWPQMTVVVVAVDMNIVWNFGLCQPLAGKQIIVALICSCLAASA